MQERTKRAKQLIDRIQILESRHRFLDFAKYTFDEGKYDVNWHHRLLADRLQKFIDGEIKFLLVSMPPQHGKSELISKLLPAYLFGKNPDLNIAYCSYSADLARKFNRKLQRLMESGNYKKVFPSTGLYDKSVRSTTKGSYLRTTDEFDIVGFRGGFKSVGVGGGLSGNKVDIGIVDDPFKDILEGASPVIQDKVWEWFSSVFLARMHNDSQMIIVHTRWHVNDLIGRILKFMNKDNDWEVVRLEAIKTEDFHEEDKRAAGEALWPKRHSLNKLLKTRAAGEKVFNAVYQQDPKPYDGNRYSAEFDKVRHVVSFDWLDDMPAHFTLDFNVSPYMSGLVCQIRHINEPYFGHNDHVEVRVWKQYALEPPRNSAKHLGSNFVADFVEDIIPEFFLYGDASGNNRLGTSDTKTLFEDVRNGFGQYKRFCTKRIPAANPRYRNIGKGMMGRRTFLNACLSGEVGAKIMIHPSCTELIKDLSLCTQDANGRLAKPKNREGIEERGHMLQAFEYLICHPKAIGYLAKI